MTTGRVTNALRDSTLRRIQTFFDEACEAITAPNFEEIFADEVQEYKTPRGVASVFFGRQYSDIEVHYLDGNWSQPLKDPEEYYGLEDGSMRSDIVILLDKYSNPPTEVVRYCEQYTNLKNAGNEFKKAARIALEETTIKRALERLPELEKFLK